MITLYHHGSSVCAAKVRIVLAEKSLPWEDVYIDILRGDQFDPAYMKLNPKAVVPTLVHDGKVIVESSVIGEYLDEAFPDPPLKPAAPAHRAAMRLWTKAIDEFLHPACAELTFASCHRHIVGRLPPEKFAQFLESTPAISVTADWHARKKEIVLQGMAAPGVERTFRLYDSYLQKMENTLAQQPWLAGDAYIARRYQHDPVCEPAGYAGYVGDVGEQPAAADRLVRAHEVASELQTVVARYVSAPTSPMTSRRSAR